jgi:hypothetical protein
MKFSLISRTALSLLLVVTLTACKNPSQYISPRITGRVIDAQTHRPLEDVAIRRITGQDIYHSGEQLKGAQQIQLPAPVLTSADGTFEMVSTKALAFFRSVGWYAVTLSFKHDGYQDLLASYSLSQATNTPAGEPLVKAGDVLLEPVSK